MAVTQDTTSPFTRVAVNRPQVRPFGALDPNAPPPMNPTSPTTTPAPVNGAAWTTDPQYANMDPNLRQIYTETGMTPAGSGTGFADWNYWQNTAGPSQYNRLRADIMGTGTDQPTGTPGTGAWQSSGAADRAGGGIAGGSLSPFTAQAFKAALYSPSATLTDPRVSSLYDSLIKRSQMGENVTAQDPIIREQVEPYRAEATRGAKSALSAMAEKGSPNTNMDAATRSAYEKAGQATGAFQAQAMTNELAARRAEINQALSGASGLLTAEQSMQLQEELAQLDAQLSAWGTTQGLGANESQFARNLAQRAFEFDTGQYNTMLGG